MGQLFLPDNLPNIAVASTTSVTLAATNQGQPTTVTVGGQQYTLSSTLTLATGSTGANGLDTGSLGAIQLWYVYAIANSSTFAPALIASSSAPSTGPTIPGGYFSAYKLVGAFYTNGSSQVGSTVTISGIAMSNWTTFSVSILAGGGVRGTGVTENAQWRRNGDQIEVIWQYAQTGAGTAGTSTYQFGFPGSLVPDNNKILATAALFGFINMNIGTAAAGSTTTGQKEGLVSYSPSTATNAWSMVFPNNSNPWNGNSNVPRSTYFSFSDTDLSFEAKFMVPISGWNPTLL